MSGLCSCCLQLTVRLFCSHTGLCMHVLPDCYPIAILLYPRELCFLTLAPALCQSEQQLLKQCHVHVVAGLHMSILLLSWLGVPVAGKVFC